MVEFRKLFPAHISSALVALYSHSLIKRVALGTLGIFEAIFLYEVFGHKLELVLIYFLIIYALNFFLLPIGAHVVSQIGYRRSMRTGVLFLVMWFCLIASVALGWLPPSILFGATIAAAVYKSLYWLPFHVELAEFTNQGNRGRYTSLVDSTVLVIGIVLPIISAFIISQFGFASLMMVSLVVILASLIPLNLLPDVKEDYSYGYWQSFKELLVKPRQRGTWAYLAEGVEDFAGAVIWPIFIFLLLRGQYLQIGYVSALVILTSALLKLLIGELSDERGPKKFLRWGTIFTSIAWLARVFIQTFNQIFLVGIFHNLSDATTKTAWNILWYQKTADQGHLIDEYTTLREMSLSLGRVITILLILIFLPFIPLTVTFIMAALAVLLLNLLR